MIHTRNRPQRWHPIPATAPENPDACNENPPRSSAQQSRREDIKCHRWVAYPPLATVRPQHEVSRMYSTGIYRLIRCTHYRVTQSDALTQFSLRLRNVLYFIVAGYTEVIEGISAKARPIAPSPSPSPPPHTPDHSSFPRPTMFCHWALRFTLTPCVVIGLCGSHSMCCHCALRFTLTPCTILLQHTLTNLCSPQWSTR